MPILSGDIKLVASQVMDDVAEGGGAPTALVIADGVSNAIFPDISELDRAGGRVNLRKLHVSVQTDDRDTYLGSNIIVAEPPADPRVSVTLFTTESTFDRRLQAQSRVESYLNKGPLWPGILYENHIMGQRSIQILQETKTELPAIGQTLVLVQYEGAGNEVQQYIRTTAVESVTRTFYDANGNPYDKAVVTLSISDALRQDLTGSPASKQLSLAINAAKVRDTVVADAGTYVGVVPLAQTANLGDFTLSTESIYTQLVPSAQTESPIIDSRPTQQAFALVPAGDVLTQDITLAFTTTQNMFLGGMIMPGSLTVTRSGITLTDSGKKLMNGAIQVGNVDYENGILSLQSNVFGATGGTHVVGYAPATKFEASLKSTGYIVTQETRSISYVRSLEPQPRPGTLTVSYMVGLRWYVLYDEGGGALRGLSSAYGVGTINYATGTVAVTLGALPDVGSAIIFQWVDSATAVPLASSPLRRFAKLATPFNTAGQISPANGPKSIQPSGLTMTWSASGATKTCTDNGLGRLTGDADGYVDYSAGVIWWSPNIYPPKDTLIGLDINGALPTTLPGVPVFGGVVAANLQPFSVHLEVVATVNYNGKQRSDAITGSSGTNSSSSSTTEGSYVGAVSAASTNKVSQTYNP